MNEFHIYSPEEEIFSPIFKEKKIRVFLKRDDVIHPFISGNKWRKLKYNLIQARKENKNHLVTFGGVWSNHLLATACAAAKYGFKSTAFVRGEDIESDTLLFCRLFGMNLIFSDRDTYRDKESLYTTRYAQDQETIFINEGGAGENAVNGCAEIITELNRSYDHIFCAAGTGATFTGLLKGQMQNNPALTCHCVPVLKGAGFLKNEIERYFEEPPSFQFHDSYHFGGYAKTNKTLLQFISNFSSSTGILLDPIYTGKMMYALYDLAINDYFERGSEIIAVHTGGLFGLLGMKGKISDALIQITR